MVGIFDVEPARPMSVRRNEATGVSRPRKVLQCFLSGAFGVCGVVLLVACSEKPVSASSSQTTPTSEAAGDGGGKIHPAQIDPARVAREMTARMETRLRLNAEQKARVEEINLRYTLQIATQMKSLAEGKGKKLPKARAIKQLQARKDGEMKGVLNEAQYKEYEAMRDEMRQMLRQRMQERD